MVDDDASTTTGPGAVAEWSFVERRSGLTGKGQAYRSTRCLLYSFHDAAHIFRDAHIWGEESVEGPLRLGVEIHALLYTHVVLAASF